MRDPAVEDGEVRGGLEVLTFGAAQPLGQVGAAQRRRDDHVFDDGALGTTPVQTELIRRLGVSAHGQSADDADGEQAREDVQREQPGSLSATSPDGHTFPLATWSVGRSIQTYGQRWMRWRGTRVVQLGTRDAPGCSMASGWGRCG